ncbi:MAG: response regulator transcription factor [Clostridia bacterium]|nr:response regulator transcription factor [Clostridia bacterium]
MQYKVLIVEDDRSVSDALEDCLSGWEMEPRSVRDFKNVMGEFRAFAPHLVLMDIGLPYLDGYSLCKSIRAESSAPVIFISAASENMNIVMAMELGADDFIVKPFDRSVLIAKLRAHLRRAYEFADRQPELRLSDAVLDTGEHCLKRNGERIELTKNEYRILHVLLTQKGKLVRRDTLMEALWQTDSFVDENTLTVNVARLRKKLAAAGLGDPVRTRFGEGYILREDV